MKKLIVLSMLAAASTVAAGVDFKESKQPVPVENPCVFRNTEYQVDAFGQGALRSSSSPSWGGGAGLNIFFLRYIGLGAEQSLAGAASEPAGWSTSASFLLRYPICSWRMAPYAMVGGGAIYGTGETFGTGHVGGGVEIRLTENVGIFTDARWLYAPNINNADGGVIARTGLRFVF